MESCALNLLTLNFKEILIEEIALDGLEGITPEKLIKCIENRLSRRLTGKIKARLWRNVLADEEVTLYQLPEPREIFESLDRFTMVEEETGNLISPETYVDGNYEYNPVKGDMGSCTHYETRQLVPKNIPEVQTLEEVEKHYGFSLVLVASLRQRCQALAPHKPVAAIANLTQQQYCVLELIGRARENGQVTIGSHSNLVKFLKDPKTQFYSRKSLEKLGVIKSVIVNQYYAGRGTATLLLRLNRFHKPKFLSTPKVGKLAMVVNHLRTQPDFCDDYNNLLKNNVVDTQRYKKIKKLSLIKVEDVVVDDEEKLPVSSKKPRKRKDFTRYIRLNIESDDEERHEDDKQDNDTPTDIPCQYMVGVSLPRQAYEIFLSAGRTGLSIHEMGAALGVGYYASRRLLKMLRVRRLLTHAAGARKDHRAPRFVAKAAITKDTIYDEELRKLLGYYENANKINELEDEIPRKKLKLTESKDIDPKYSEDNAIIERKDFNDPVPSFTADPNKIPSIRQLQFANGVLKMTREKLAISGYQSISQMIAKQLNTKFLDRKPLKRIVERLALDGQVRLFNIKWPNQDRYAELICAPNVTADHPILKSKYREMYLRTICSDKQAPPPPKQKQESRVKNEYAFKRYMRVRKLHEFVFNLVYTENFNPNNDLPHGFTSLLEMIPEMTVGLAAGFIQKYKGSQIGELRINEAILDTKLKDSPSDVFQQIFASKNLRATLVSTMTILATFGLVQICNRTHKPAESSNSHLIKYSFYINKNAKLIDTRGDWPRDEKAETLTFRLETNEDVERYWSSLYEIAVNTKVKNRPFAENKFFVPKSPVFPQDGADERDDGRTITDGGGAAGLHSAYYIESQNLWIASLAKPMDLPKPKPKLSKLKIRHVKSKKAIKAKKAKKLFQERRPKGSHRVRIVWSEYDDEIILLCRAAVVIISPAPQPGCYIIRNTVARDLISDPAKTVFFCHKRSTACSRKNQGTIDQLVAEFRKRPEFPKYDDMLTKLRHKSQFSMAKFTQEAKLPTMELVWLLYQLKRSESFVKPKPCVAVDYESLLEKFQLLPLAPPKQYDLYKKGKSPDSNELRTLKEAIMMTLFLTSDETQVSVETCIELYKYLATKSNELLMNAVADLRRSGCIVCVKKHLLHQNFKSDSWHEVVESSTFGSIKAFGISKYCQRRFSVRLNNDFADDVAVLLFEDMPKVVVGSPEMNCVVFEAVATGNVVITSNTNPTITGYQLREEGTDETDEDSGAKLQSGDVLVTRIVAEESASGIADSYRIPCDVFKALFQELLSECKIQANYEEYDENDPIIALLLQKAENGCSFNELKEIWNGDYESLITKLKDLESRHIIKRVGFFDNVIILTKFHQNWSIIFSDHIIIPAPWIKEDICLNLPLFVRLCAVVLNKVFEMPGKSLSQVAQDCDCIASRNVKVICDFLLKLDCVTMKTVVYTEPDLFSDDVEPVLESYNKYASHDTIAVFPVKDAISKFVVYRKNLLNMQV